MIFKNTFVSFIYLFIFTKPRVVALVIRAPIATNPLSSQKVILQENCRKSALGMRLEAKALAQRALYSWRGCQYRTSEMTKATPKKATLENKYLRNCDYFVISHLVGTGGKKPSLWCFGEKSARRLHKTTRVYSRVSFRVNYFLSRQCSYLQRRWCFRRSFFFKILWTWSFFSMISTI